jgi:DNA-binding response OmpR family regulator
MGSNLRKEESKFLLSIALHDIEKKPKTRTRTKIWVLEDDPGIQFLYQEILELSYDISIFGTLAEFEDAFCKKADSPELVIADLRLPDANFLTFLKPGDKPSPLLSVPYIVVSSLDDMDAIRTCFDNGASDYIYKPFGKNELLLKIERILAENVVRRPLDNLSIDSKTFRVSNGKTSVSLTTKEFQIISLLFNSKSLTVNRTELMTKIWNKTDTGSKTLDVHLHNLRRKIMPLGLKIVHRHPYEYFLSGE